jgi:pimeloyl-ACP methyl ester carboxylesterase
MTLHVHHRGEGRALVVLPSFGFTHAGMVLALEPALATLPDWHRLYVDLPGAGGSAAGPPTSDSVLQELVETVGQELATAPFGVLGWSYGGYLAAGLARRLPHQARALMMVCGSFKIRPADRDLTGALPSIPEPGWLDDIPTHLHGHFTQAIGHQTAAVAKRVAGGIAASTPIDESYLSALRGDGFALTDEDHATHCEGPVSFVTGRRDRVAGHAALFGALAGFDDATYVVSARAGHYLPFEQPAFFAAAVAEWLGR